MRYRLAVILGLALCAVVAGTRSFTAIAEWAADADEQTLRMLGITGAVPSAGCPRAPRGRTRLECIEEGGTEPTIALLRHLAATLDADVCLPPGHDLGSVGFESHAA